MATVTLDILAQADPAVASAIQNERRRQIDGIELIASENYVSEAVLAAVGTVLTNKYAEGLPGKRYYGGCEYVDIVENHATGMIDYDEVLRIAKEVRPKAIISGASAYSRSIDFERFRQIADEVGAYLFSDIAHIAGLIAAGENPTS